MATLVTEDELDLAEFRQHLMTAYPPMRGLCFCGSERTWI